jgi:hypothetical protein
VLLERAMKVYYKDRNSGKFIVYLITSPDKIKELYYKQGEHYDQYE